MKAARPLHSLFRAAVLGLALGSGMIAPVPAQEIPTTDGAPAADAAAEKARYLAGVQKMQEVLESAKDEMPSEVIEMNVRNIYRFYRLADAAPADVPEARIRAAEKRLYKITADSWMRELWRMDSYASTKDLDGGEKEIRQGYRRAGVTIDAALEAQIVATMKHAHAEVAGIGLKTLETINFIANPYAVDNQGPDILAHLRAAGTPADAALQARIQAATLHAHRVCAELNIRKITEATSAEQIEDLEEMARLHYQMADIPLDSTRQAAIRQAVTAGYKHVAENMLEWLERYSLRHSAEETRQADRQMRHDFAAGGVAIDPALDKRIHAALAHASRPWIPSVH